MLPSVPGSPHLGEQTQEREHRSYQAAQAG